ncbi:MAG: NUDIX hydrolase [Asticcacaulis sp.]
MQAPNTGTPKVCVGVVCIRDDKVLLIRRGRPPRQGHWSIPGGKLEFGETLHDAALRELHEETGCTARIGRLIQVYELIEEGFHYVLVDYLATYVQGEPQAADDASEARFVSFDEAEALMVEPDLKDVIRRARILSQK